MPLLLGGLIVQAILWLFKSRIGWMITQIFLWLGLTYATTKLVLTPTIDAIKGYAQFSGGSGEMAAAAVAWLGVLKFDVALTMLFGAISLKAATNAGRAFLTRRGAVGGGTGY